MGQKTTGNKIPASRPTSAAILLGLMIVIVPLGVVYLAGLAIGGGG